MDKKNIFLYSIVFIIIFTILTISNFLYKKFVVNLDFEHLYEIRALQEYNLKKNITEKLLSDVFEEEENNNAKKNLFFKVEDFKTKEINSYGFSSSKTEIRFNLITNLDIDANKLENKLNKIYISSIENITEEYYKNISNFDYNTIEKLYETHRSDKINSKLIKLKSSQFFEKYKPVICESSKAEDCLKAYQDYYNYILKQIENNTDIETILSFLKLKNNSENYSYLKLLNDFLVNKVLYDDDELFELRKLSNMSNDKYNFFKAKYDQFIKSEFFVKYVDNVDQICFGYKDGCFLEISNYFNSNLYKLTADKLHKFKVTKINKKNTLDPIRDIPIILGLSLFITYFLSELIKKSLRKKLK